jgi:hypothetical protein
VSNIEHLVTQMRRERPFANPFDIGENLARVLGCDEAWVELFVKAWIKAVLNT